MNEPAVRARLALAALVLLAGCAVPRAATPPRHYLLEAPAALAVLAERAALRIAVGPLALAEYLDQPRIVSRRTRHELDLQAHARWAMPLAQNLVQVLRDALEQHLPGMRTSVFPGLAPAPYDYRVVLEITRLDGYRGGTVTLEAGWRVLDAKDAGVAGGEGRVRLERESANASVAALVDAEAALVAELAERIAAHLVALTR